MSDLPRNTLYVKIRKLIEVKIRTNPANLSNWTRFIVVLAATVLFPLLFLTLFFLLL